MFNKKELSPVVELSAFTYSDLYNRKLEVWVGRTDDRCNKKTYNGACYSGNHNIDRNEPPAERE